MAVAEVAVVGGITLAMVVVVEMALAVVAGETEVTAVVAKMLAVVTGEAELVMFAVVLETTDAYVLGRTPLGSTGAFDTESSNIAP